MKKYLALLGYEFKTILKDSLSMFLLFYPLVLLFILGVFIPLILEKTDDVGGQTIVLLIVLTVGLSLGGTLAGAMLGLSFLDNKDENTILSIAVSPVRVGGYAMFKITYSYVLAVLGNFIMMGGLKLIASDAYVIAYNDITIRLLDNLTWGKIILFSFVNGLLVPMFALAIGSFAKNKVEGFALMKSSGIIIMIPALSLLNFFQDAKQYLLGVFPNFWAIKAMLNEALMSDSASDLSFAWYLIIGSAYLIVVGFLMYRVFIKKLNIK